MTISKPTTRTAAPRRRTTVTRGRAQIRKERRPEESTNSKCDNCSNERWQMYRETMEMLEYGRQQLDRID